MATEKQNKKKVRSELLQLDTESTGGIDLDFVAVEAGDISLDASASRQHSTLKRKRGEKVFSDMLFVLTHRHFHTEEAKKLWFRIVQHKKELNTILSRNPGITVAALDFLSNIVDEPNIALIYEDKMSHVREIALQDGMTGLYDHSSFQTKLKEEIARFNRHGTVVSLIMADVDFFKKYNDTYGHERGDQILKSIAAIMMHEIRNIDIGARYGGEEFAIIVNSSRADDAYLLAERIRKCIKKEFAETGKVTVSFGVADCTQTDATPPGLIRAADEALYAAKKQGRNRTVLYNPSLHKEMSG
ncbi:MAG: GGDEF domain-containing protein [Thermodesulfobacteriota bacterium]|nr:GGDEF domain-containing protein [Thermodesulfobacteriota bacterium]